MRPERNILIAFILNLGFSIFEAIGGFFTGSIAILSDSIHDFGDALSIGISYFLEKKSKKKADDNYTYGYVRYSVLGSIITTLILLIGSIFVIIESIKRLINPIEINYNGMLIIAILGTIINFAAVYYTMDGESLNQKAVNIHMLEDVLGWFVVLIGAIVMKFTSISIIDPILSICVALFIFYHAFKNIMTINDLFLEKTPKNISIEELRNELLKIKGIKEIHHIHLRSLDGYHNFITLHVVVSKYNKKIKEDIRTYLQKVGISHSTIELELEDEVCQNKDCKITEMKQEHHHS